LVICADTLAITPQRHYPAFLLGIMSLVASWAQGTIASGVADAYSNFTLPNVQFSPNVSSAITGFSYRGLVNFAGGALLQSVFLAAILMFTIDRKFLKATIWSLLAGSLSFFGLINANTVGVLVKKTDDGWRFAVAYAMLAVFFSVLEVVQRKHWIKGQETEPDDLSSIEWAEWKREQALEESNTDGNIQTIV
jgi:AGZA family xanthine/uracil permease-like MFS transporter